MSSAQSPAEQLRSAADALGPAIGLPVRSPSGNSNLLSLGAIIIALIVGAMHILPKLALLAAPAPVIGPYTPPPATPAIKAFDVQCPYCRGVFKVQPTTTSGVGDLAPAAAGK